MGFNSSLVAFFRIITYAALTVPCMVLQAGALLLRSRVAEVLPPWYHRICCRILGVRVERRGRQSRVRPTLYVSNHASYLDIMVLGSLIRGSFVAKSEVAEWPFFGLLAKLQRSVFISRRRGDTKSGRDEMRERLESGDNLILFAEGTSDDGNRVLPFKSALFSVAELRPSDKVLTVQPVTVAYTRLDGMPMGRALRPFFAWYGDMELAPHLWEAIGMGRLTVVVHFHPPVDFETFGSRKALAEHCQSAVSLGLAQALHGRSRKELTKPAEAL